jgi:hypothetical protein
VQDKTDIVNVVFTGNGTLEAQGLGDAAVIHLGREADGTAQANSGRADLDGIEARSVTLQIHADSQQIEVDHAPHLPGVLSVGFWHEDVPLLIDDQGPDPLTSMTLHHFQTVQLDQHADQPVTLTGSLDLNGDTTALTLTTHQNGGDLTLSAPPFAANPPVLFDVPALLGGEALKDLSVQAVGGNISLAPGRYFITDAVALHTYQVTAQDADVTIGTIGFLPGPVVPGPPFGPLPSYPIPGHANELETIAVTLTDGATFESAQLFALGAPIASMILTANDHNTLAGGYNLSFGKTYANSLGYQELNAIDGGHIRLLDHAYEVHEQVFTGSGDIEISSPSGTAFFTHQGYIQTQPADASAHTGTRTWIEGGDGSLDVFYGSDKDDLVIFQSGLTLLSQAREGIYYDSGGNDRIAVRGRADIHIYDGTAGTDDVIEIGVAVPLFAARVTFHAGSGEDQVIFGPPAGFYAAFQDQNLIDFGTYLNGRVDIDGLGTVPGRALSFDGLDGITANHVAPVLTAGSTVSQIDDNRIYIIADGDAVVQGDRIQDYENLSDVAGYLSVLTSHSDASDTHAVFIVHNKTTSTAPGDDRDVYFYHFAGDGQGPGISAADLTLLGTANLQSFPGVSLPLEIQPGQIM